MSREFLKRWTRISPVVITATICNVMLSAQALAGVTIVNGTDCTPFVTTTPNPNAPIVFPYGNLLQIFRNNSDWNFAISCPLPLISGPNIASGDVTLGIVDGQSLSVVRLCFGSYYSNSISCGASSSGSGPAYFVYPPSPMPSYATTRSF